MGKALYVYGCSVHIQLFGERLPHESVRVHVKIPIRVMGSDADWLRFTVFQQEGRWSSSGPLSVTQHYALGERGSRDNCLDMLVILASFLANRYVLRT